MTGYSYTRATVMIGGREAVAMVCANNQAFDEVAAKAKRALRMLADRGGFAAPDWGTLKFSDVRECAR